MQHFLDELDTSVKASVIGDADEIFPKTNLELEKFMNQEQCLLSQILHDLISPFTSLSAGLDMLDGDSDDDLWRLVRESKQNLYTQISLMRYLFSSDESLQSGMHLLKKYAATLDIRILEAFEDGELRGVDCPKILIFTGFWLLKKLQRYRHCNVALHIEARQFTILGVKNLITPRELLILNHKIPAQNAQESYLNYLAALAHLKGLLFDMVQHPNLLTLSFQSLV